MPKENGKQVKHPENAELGKRLKYGDRKDIARVTGYSQTYVRKVLTGERHNQTVVDFARRLVEQRQELMHRAIDQMA